MSKPLAEVAARVRAPEAERSDSYAVLAAITVVGANQRELTVRAAGVENRLASVEDRLTAVDATVVDSNGRVRSLEESVAEMKDLLIRALGR